MATIKERHESLKGFKPVYLLEYLDEKNRCSHQLIFHPALGLFEIISSSWQGRLPSIIISFNDFIKGSSDCLNKSNKIDSLISTMIDLWKRMKADEKMSFCDSIPLNSLYIGCQYR